MLANYHTHTNRNDHSAPDDDRKYIENAIAAGLKVLGFTEHVPYPFPNGFVSHYRLPVCKLDDYFHSLRRLKAEYAGQIEIHIGFEAEYYPSLWEDMLALIRPYAPDYLILGQHFAPQEHLPEGKPSGAPHDDPAQLKAYVDLVCGGMDTGLFSYVAHPDLIRFTGDPELRQNEYRRLCQKAKQTDTPLEINLLGIRAHRPYPTPEFWRIAAEEGNTAIIGSDAHDAASVADPVSYPIARQMADDLGLKYIDFLPLRPVKFSDRPYFSKEKAPILHPTP